MSSGRLTASALGLIMMAALIVCIGCERTDELDGVVSDRMIRMIGSTTVLPLAEHWHRGFNQINPHVNMAVSGGGSGSGIEALVNGTAEIAMSSRDISSAEIERARAAGVEPVRHVVGYDAIVMIVHPTSPVRQLSVEQLSDIYCGITRDWQDVGGNPGEIQVISRDSASGTFESFKDMVVTLDGTERQRDYAARTLKQPSNVAILNLVRQTETAIGYVGLGYVDETVRPLSIINIGEAKPVEPTLENIIEATYPIARALHFYTDGEPTGVLKEFMEYVISPDGQAIVEELGFAPIAG